MSRACRAWSRWMSTRPCEWQRCEAITMPELRWILIIFGVILLAGIYVWGRRGNKQGVGSDDALVRMRPEPHVPAHDAYAPTLERKAAADVAVEDSDDFMDDEAAADEPAIVASRPAVRDEEEFEVPAPSRATEQPREASPVRRGRVEPTFSDDTALTEELPVHESAAASASVDAPTLAMSDTPQPRRIERRKIIALRLAATSDRFAGPQLREALEAESLQHGKYQVFHRQHDDGVSIFSVASMVEPGTFDLEQMRAARYPGVTLFAQLPGPIPGVQALHELVACGKRLQEALGGTLQDE